MHWHNYSVHTIMRQIQEEQLSGYAVIYRKTWHDMRARRRPGLRSAVGWIGAGLVQAGEWLRAWSAAAGPAEA